ncbi:hypothetical protein NAEGRDRAFT_56826 [Naegleria gruberi]|uniref:YrhK domain-containing protein n=1 Tax=Naegleria gruberi TaxID=5762 RepID=D2V1U5_NAEGR|nr:uncharacterized protein NAEGRDRAFT_56826 [Naegleria gruberi]EFC49371.1 hypothetical protein NAEGRDRAFT_56826 [Naegleria gruberi]|eukprot:XP_002682115.1 hypothetical protein NAEGRDRAFT_56826 [Naegleria gruberi strain NEG-M]
MNFMNFKTSHINSKTNNQEKHFSYSADHGSSSNSVVIVDIIEDAEENNYTKGKFIGMSSQQLHDSLPDSHNQINKKMQTNPFNNMQKKQGDSTCQEKALETKDNIIGENIEMLNASTIDLSKISPSIISSLCEKNNHQQQPDITPPSGCDNQHYEKSIIGKLEETLVEPIHMEAFSIQPSYSRNVMNSSSSHHEEQDNNNEIILEPPQRKYHHALSYSNSSHSSTSTTSEEGETFSIYTLDGSLTNLHHQEQPNSSNNLKQLSTSTAVDNNNSTLDLLQSIRDEHSKINSLLHNLQHDDNKDEHSQFHHEILHRSNKTIVNNNKKHQQNITTTIKQEHEESNKTREKNSKIPSSSILVLVGNHQQKNSTLIMMRGLNIAAFALLDISFVIGAALFVAGCGLLIANNVTFFFSGILLFIIGSVLFLVGPLGKALVDVINLIRHFRWEKKVKEITNLQNESSKRLKDQMHELHQDISSYRPPDLPPLKMIILEMVNDFFLILGGLTFTIGSSLYMLNPPILIVIIAEVNWSVGAISYLIVSIIQYIVKQVDIIKSARNGMDINVKCFTFMSIDLSAYLLNITSSLLFTIGSGCFLVNERSLEITGEVIWSLGCIAMIIAVICNRIIWIKSTWFERKDTTNSLLP